MSLVRYELTTLKTNKNKEIYLEIWMDSYCFYKVKKQNGNYRDLKINEAPKDLFNLYPERFKNKIKKDET